MTDDTLELAPVRADLPAPPGPPGPAVAAPVFVDGSGRRQRRVRRAGRLLAVPAAGYVVLLVSSALGGPTVNSPFLPLPGPPATSAPPGPAAQPPAPTAAAPSQGPGGVAGPARSTPSGHHASAPGAAPLPVAAHPSGPPTATAPSTTPAPSPTTAGPPVGPTPGGPPSHSHPVHTPHP
ncbi:hypothetical protein GCM10009665_26520 [Kitasatospora nipponensis]|uniref:Uncharacterized protein n=1 Tax=Kitasatospora nipponensis TaxID=258049 RepID=A0ABP4GRE4_9ACTN